ncbi:MAG: hypothetical protein ACRDMX_04970, partial [Solirubrobacteraceae bacterium]
LRAALVACGLAAALFAFLGLVACNQPLRRASTRSVRYTQRASFGYRATARPGPVYPSGAVTTGDTVFTALVHRLRVRVGYQFASAAKNSIAGTYAVSLKLTGPSGWSRTIPLAAPRPFAGPRWHRNVTLDLPALQALLNSVARLTGVATSGDGSLALVADVHARGSVAGKPINASFQPILTLALAPLQLAPASGTVGSGQTAGGFSPQAHGSVVVPATQTNTLGVASIHLSIALLRKLTLAGLALALVGAALVAVLLRRRGAFAEAARIQARYGQLLVPIAAGEDLGWPPVDVASIKALVALAQCSGQLILHSHDDTADTYLVNDEGTVYRYQAKLPKVTWGEWSEHETPLADEVAAPTIAPADDDDGEPTRLAA